MGALRVRADELAGSLVGAGLKATTDTASIRRPGVLVPPPSVDYTTRTVTFRLALLSAQDAGTTKAWDELDDLLEAVEAVLPLDSAEPGSYALPTGGGSPPAYLATFTTSL